MVTNIDLLQLVNEVLMNTGMLWSGERFYGSTKQRIASMKQLHLCLEWWCDILLLQIDNETEPCPSDGYSFRRDHSRCLGNRDHPRVFETTETFVYAFVLNGGDGLNTDCTNMRISIFHRRHHLPWPLNEWNPQSRKRNRSCWGCQFSIATILTANIWAIHLKDYICKARLEFHHRVQSITWDIT